MKSNAHPGLEVFLLAPLILLLLGAGVVPEHPADGGEAAEATMRAERKETQGITTADQLEAGGRWRLESLEIDGVGFFRAQVIRSQLETQPRSRIAFWREYPEFEPSTFLKDLARVERLLEADGYYAAHVTHEVIVLREPEREIGAREGEPGGTDLELHTTEASAPGGEAPNATSPTSTAVPGLVKVKLDIDLGTPVVVCTLGIDLGPVALPSDDEAQLRKRFPLAVGHVFTERDYQAGAERILAYFKQHGYAGAEVQHEARVDVPQRCVAVSYVARPGEPAVFGETAVVGLDKVSQDVVRKELAYSPGEPYDSRKIDDSQRQLRNLRLFSIVRLSEQQMTPDDSVPIVASLHEGPQHEIRLGLGYSTEDQVRGLFAWRNYNFLGDARQLGVSAKVSLIERRINADFVQPHWPGDRGRTSLTYALEEDDESTYLLNASRVVPRIDWRLGRELAAFVFSRTEYDTLSGVSQATKDMLADYVNSGFTVSAGVGARWARLDDPLNPQRGIALDGTVESAGGPLDADFTFLRLIGDVRAYHELIGDLGVATRARIGFATPYGGTAEIPLWDRFYAGGTNSVRGYGRRRVGPISASNDPVGGRSLFEGSLELRHPLYGPIGGALFVDAGDVELQSWHLDPADVQVGVGFGVRANTPVGPAELDLGFGLDRHSGDSLVQVSFTIGPSF